MSLTALLASMAEMDSSEDKNTPDATPPQNPEKLKELFERLYQKHEFSPGDLVDWKPGLQNSRINGPFIVCRVLDQPVLNTSDKSTSSSFNEPLDLVLGIIRNGLFFEHHLDSRRLQPYIAEASE